MTLPIHGSLSSASASASASSAVLGGSSFIDVRQNACRYARRHPPHERRGWRSERGAENGRVHGGAFGSSALFPDLTHEWSSVKDIVEVCFLQKRPVLDRVLVQTEIGDKMPPNSLDDRI